MPGRTRMVRWLDGSRNLVDLDGWKSYSLDRDLAVMPMDPTGRHIHVDAGGRWVVETFDGLCFESLPAALARSLLGSHGLYDVPDELKSIADFGPSMPGLPPILLGASYREPVAVLNVELPPLRPLQYHVLAPVVRAYPHGIHTAELEADSRVPGFAKIFCRLAKAPVYRMVLKTAGREWGGYQCRWPELTFTPSSSKPDQAIG